MDWFLYDIGLRHERDNDTCLNQNLLPGLNLLNNLVKFCSHKIPPRKIRRHGGYRENVPSSFCQPK